MGNSRPNKLSITLKMTKTTDMGKMAFEWPKDTSQYGKKLFYESKFQLLGNDSRLFMNLKGPNYSSWKKKTSLIILHHTLSIK